MAVDVTQKAVNLCRKIRFSATKIMEAVEELEAYKNEKESSGIDLSAAAVNTALLAEADLKHADGTGYTNVLSSGAAVKTFLETNFHDDVFDTVRP